MELVLKALAGAIVVIIIQLLARTKNFYLAGLVPLFPTFALISHYIVGTERTIGELKTTILFGICALVPYFVYLLALYVLVDQFKLSLALVAATLCWTLAALLLILLWNRG